jgi:hypothetical protein
MTDESRDPPEDIALSPVRRVKGGSHGLHPLLDPRPHLGPAARAFAALVALIGQHATEALHDGAERPTWFRE